jgi:hypothetical protein
MLCVSLFIPISFSYSMVRIYTYALVSILASVYNIILYEKYMGLNKAV